MKITILGAGAWGTALAIQAAARHEVLLWARDSAAVAEMAATRRNQRYLPDTVLPDGLALSADLAAAIAHGRDGLLIVATPMAGLREMLAALPDGAGVLWLCKGFEAGTGLLGHQIAAAVQPRLRVGILSGPSFAQEVAAGQPTALVAASGDAALAQLAVDAFHSERLRVYTSADPVGVEVGGAVKNVMAIAVGIADGLGQRAGAGNLLPGLNARAALITRGLAEMLRLGQALGARTETFMGLSGIGDLVLTATGDLSRNRRVGLLLAEGLALPQILQQLGHVAEGVYSAPTVLARAAAAGVDMPITAAVVAVLEGRLSPVEAVELLMGREARPEH
ncbi:NAD(P)-dependent glycerol-3-phosphate dehydrogenase [Paucibacter sp. O1-1]|uniref:NAD(P)H-dependent glycerol-3-phosphate dehydrogenase n=1 Tax=Paucibacter sp. M5-1 TaxID=3015998 RepID=UPI0021D4AE6F|nr:NAD(P)H-dependent glycerol-3-phosphate dehydrogenase [Paucibacter sp. M5-1]MCU7373399.1 NAD(P)-dependent glycerol-3-phosphate dehydrogenase [Paucibacter sp. O1-1]MCZ7879690.1 NAD(P)-dependent glycerol-3-phosphate dehydrogenase [Paucibacter sp. M5-1]MDA3828398.1 NAD(P)-dependent glycerol-3-phosphate dehydrogenase [Paucibacter sp. O1-1]